jgi:excisionase family DNA binding protein
MSATLLETALEELLRRVIRQEIRAALTEIGLKNRKRITRDYLSIKEVVDVSRLAVPTIRLFIRKRKLPALKVGRRVLIKRADLEKYLEAQPIRAAS